jgi:transcriptional regulator with XRE-family HTH domain
MVARTPDTSGKTGSEALARIVRERRENLGLTRQELADASGIPYPTIAQIETAYRGVSPARLGVIARLLGLDPKELYEVLASEEAAERGPAPIPTSPTARTSSMPPKPSSQRGSRPTAAPADASGRWHANPQFVAALAAPATAPPASEPPTPTRRSHSTARTTDRTADVVKRAVDLLSELPAGERIEAQGRVQNRLLERIVEERVERDGG